MIPFIVAVLIVVVATLAYVALRNAQDFSDANEIIPGVPTSAPKEWAGAHSPEARLHRRLRDAMEAVRANAAMDDPSLVPVRAELEQQALATDQRLVAAAALPKGRREEPIRRIGEDVSAIEELVASLVELRGPVVSDAGRRIDEVRTRLTLLEEAHRELAALDPGSDDLSSLRARLEADAGVPATDGAEDPSVADPAGEAEPGEPEEPGAAGPRPSP